MSAQSYLDQFQTRTSDGEPAWLSDRRKASIAAFGELGFPSRREENWKYTNLAPFAKKSFAPVTSACSADLSRAGSGFGGPRLVFVDGRLDRNLSTVDTLPRGVTLTPLSERLQADDGATLLSEDQSAFAHLNAAFFEDGTFVQIDSEIAVEETIEVVYLATQAHEASSHVRNVFVAGPGSKALIVEQYLGEREETSGSRFTTAITDVRIAASARLDHVKLLSEGSTVHVAETRGNVATGGNYANHFFTFATQLVRNEIDVNLAGETSHADLNGLYVTDREEHVDCFTTLQHRVPHCTSWEMYRGVLGGRSTGNFRGKIDVYPDAQKTDAKQSSNHLLLTNTATGNSKPCLEIYADDVRCTHGATIGHLDEDALFYLRSRAIGETAARQLLTRAFAGEVVDAITHEAVRDHLDGWLGRHVLEALENAQENGAS
ncbi:MAG: Fe-S cluster assembly protein SufD [Planctomycetota bacterium]